MKHVLLSILLALIPSIVAGQTTVLPKTTVLPHTTLIAGGSGGGPTITFDAMANSGACTASPCQWNHTVGTVSTHNVLVVSIHMEDPLSALACTFNSVSMTLLGSERDSVPLAGVAVFILAAPATGTHQVSCSATSMANFAVCESSSWYGVNQSTPNRTVLGTAIVNDGGTMGTAISVPVTNAASGDVVIDATTTFDQSTMTSGAGQTQLFNATNANDISGQSSWITATGSKTMTQTANMSVNWADIGIALIPG